MGDRDTIGSRGVDQRGTDWDTPLVEPIESFYDFGKDAVVGSLELPDDLDLEVPADGRAIRRFAHRVASLVTFRDGPAYLIQFARIIEPHITPENYRKSPPGYLMLVETAVGIAETLLTRTQGPFRRNFGLQVYAALDRRALSIDPIGKDFASRKAQASARDAVLSGRALIMEPVPVAEQPFVVDDTWQKDLERVEASIEATAILAELAVASKGDMPQVNRCIARLRKLRFATIEAKTRARHPRHWRDDSVHEHVELMLYHSIFSVVLDKNGDPNFDAGFHHALIIAPPGHPMERALQPPGLYVSTGRLADNQLLVTDTDVRSILFGGIGSFVETGASFSWEHPQQAQLQGFVDVRSHHAVAAIVVSEAFGGADITFSNVVDRVPAVVKAMSDYVVPELERRLDKLYENFAEIVKQVGMQILRTIIIDRVKSWLIGFIIKKVGKRFVPGVNAVSAIAELFDDNEERDMLAAAIACLIMATRSTRRDDMTISAKVLSKLGIDKVQDAVVEQLAKRAGRALAPRKASAKAAKVPPRAAAPPEPQPPPPPPAKAEVAAPRPKAAPIADPLTQRRGLARPSDIDTSTVRPATPRAEIAAARDATTAARDTDVNRREVRTGRPAAARTAAIRGPAPKPPSLPPARMPWRERWKYYADNRGEYSPTIRKMLDDIDAKDARKTEDHLRQVEAAIREDYAADLGKHWGIPVRTVERMPKKRTTGEDTPGAAHERDMIRLRSGEDTELTAVVVTKSGAEVQVDDFDPARRVAIEHKASLDIKGKPDDVAAREIQERMTRHAELAEDHNLAGYEWVPMSSADRDKMVQALADLKAQARADPDKARGDSLLSRLSKITIADLYDYPLPPTDDE